MKHLIQLTMVMLVLGWSTLSSAQRVYCNVMELPTADMLDGSSSIVEAKVIAKTSTWNKNKSEIHTYHTMELTQAMKGNCAAVFTLITEGGRAQGTEMVFSDRIDLSVGERVMLFLTDIPKHWSCDKNDPTGRSVFGSLQGVFRIAPDGSEVRGIFETYTSTAEFANAFGLVSHKSAQQNNRPDKESDPQLGMVPVVTGMSPLTITAGTKSILTITGSGFGATQGTGIVEFMRSDSVQNGQPFPTDYILWSDTQIQVMVPSVFFNVLDPQISAANGPVRVTPANSPSATSSQVLNIPYAIFNTFIPGGNETFVLRMAGMNGTGGYDIRYNSQFQTLSANAKSSMERALNSWKCATQVNWNVLTTTTTIRNAVNDDVNVITDDVDFPLSANVLGRGVAFVTGCFVNGVLKVYAEEVDIIVNNIPGGLSWQFGPANPAGNQFDFETVFLHEIGHVHLLSHTIDQGPNVMAPTLAAGVANRNLTANDINGGLDVMNRSTIAFSCAASHVPLVPTVSISTTTALPVCAGTAITFTAVATNISPNTTLNWKKNGVIVAQGNSFTLSNPVNNDVITCQFSACTTIVSNAITVGVVSNTATINYATPFCKTLTTTQLPTFSGTTGGTYTATPAGLSLNATTGAITPSTSTAGTYVVTYSLPANGPCGAFTTTKTIVITTAPTSVFNYSSTTFCKSVTSLVVPTISGTIGGVFTATPAGLGINATTGAFTPSTSTAGTYIVTYTIAAGGGCAAVSSTKTVTIFNQLATPLTISGSPNNVCGITRIFTASAVAGAASYQWTVPSNVTVNGSTTGLTISITFPNNFTTGQLKVRAIASNGCNSNQKIINLTGAPAVPGTITISNVVVGNNSVTGTASIAPVSGAVSYLWTITNGVITSGQGTTSINVQLTNLPNSGTVCVRSVNGCGNSAQSCKTISNPLGMQEVDFATKENEVGVFDVKLFPNPASDIIQLTFDPSWEKDPAQIEIFDLSGKKVALFSSVINGETSMEYPIDNLITGIYIIHIYNGRTSKTLQFVKE